MLLGFEQKTFLSENMHAMNLTTLAKRHCIKLVCFV